MPAVASQAVEAVVPAMAAPPPTISVSPPQLRPLQEPQRSASRELGSRQRGGRAYQPFVARYVIPSTRKNPSHR